MFWFLSSLVNIPSRVMAAAAYSVIIGTTMYAAAFVAVAAVAVALIPIALVVVIASLAGSACDCSGDDDDDDDDVYSPWDDDDAWRPDDDDNEDDDIDDDIGDDDTDDDSDDDACDHAAHDPAIVAGKDYLEVHDPNAAYDEFSVALEICPNSADARMGLLLADAQWYGKWLKRWIEYLSDWNPAPHKTMDKSVGTTIQAVVAWQLQPVNEEMFRFADELEADHPDVRFFLDACPMWVDGEYVVLDMGGEWDAADVSNLRSFARIWESFASLVLTFDLTFDWALFALNPAPDDATTEELIHHYSGIILDILDDEDYPDFLTFMEGGQEYFAQTAIQLGLALDALPRSFELMEEETDPQTDDVAGYVDANGNGVYDEGETHRIPYLGDLPPETEPVVLGLFDLSSNLGAAFLDDGPEDLRPLLPDWFLLSKLNPLLELLDVLIFGQRLPPIPIPIGTWFYNPPDDGLRTTVRTATEFLYNATTP